MKVTTLVSSIVDAIEDFGIENIEENTTLLVSHDNNAVKVINTDFNTFTKADAYSVYLLLDRDGNNGEVFGVDRRAVLDWVRELT